MDEPRRLPGETILGIDNIRLDLPLAGAGSRVLAAALDYGVVAAIAVLWGLLFLGLSPDLESGWWLAVMVLGFFLLEHGYFIGTEIFFGGRTLGKMAMRLRVVTREGTSADASALMLRNLVRAVDVVVGVLLMIVDARCRRLGDRIAGTLVVHDRADLSELILGRVPAGWGHREVAVVESLLARRRELQSDQARFLARRVLAWIERDAPDLLVGQSPDEDPVETLRRALAVEGDGDR